MKLRDAQAVAKEHREADLRTGNTLWSDGCACGACRQVRETEQLFDTLSLSERINALELINAGYSVAEVAKMAHFEK